MNGFVLKLINVNSETIQWWEGEL